MIQSFYLLLALPLNLLASTSTVPDSLKNALLQKPAITPFTYVKVFFLLILILSTIAFAVWLMKKFSPQLNRSLQSGMIKILATHWFGPKKGLILVQVSDKILLLGLTENNINYICEFANTEEMAKNLNLSQTNSSFANFPALLSAFWQKTKTK
jgi:flagellar biosynthetic protein FliO